MIAYTKAKRDESIAMSFTSNKEMIYKRGVKIIPTQ